MAEENGFVLKKDGETHCIVLKEEGDDGVKEGHFRADFQGKCKINGGTYRPANISESPEVSGPWRGSYYGDLETHVRRYEEEGWVRSPLESFECKLGRSL